MKIAFLTSLDAADKSSWSGTYFYMAKAIEKHIGEVVYLGPVDTLSHKILSRLLQKVRPLFSSKKYRHTHSIILSWYYSCVFRKKLAALDVDMIFAPAASVEVALLKTKIPIVYLSDATAKIMMDYYPEFTKLVNFSRFETTKLEQLAINNAKITVYPTQWAANSAINDMHAQPEKTHIIPFGANIDHDPLYNQVVERSRRTETCSLLFLAKEWERKGGPIAVNAFQALAAKGLDVELTICGCDVPGEYQNIDGITYISFLDKNKQTDLNTLQALLKNTSYLFLPTRAECYGIVFCEASAYGIPSITTATGGVAEVVVDGVNGFALELSATPQQYADVIYTSFTNKDGYCSLVQSTREHYDQCLNWDVWAQKFNDIVAPVIHSNSRSGTIADGESLANSIR